MIEECAQREPRRQEPSAVAEVVVGEQHLADLDRVRRERVLPHLHEPRLTDGRGGLERGHLGRALRHAQPRQAERDRTRRHDHDLEVAPAQR